MTTWVRATQAAVTSRGNEMEPAAGTAPASSALQKRRDYLSIHAGKNGGSRRECSPSRIAERSVFETVPARLSGSTSNKDGGSPRCRPVLCGLRDRCIAAMLATRKRKSVGMLHNLLKGPAGFQPAAARFAAPRLPGPPRSSAAPYTSPSRCGSLPRSACPGDSR